MRGLLLRDLLVLLKRVSVGRVAALAAAGILFTLIMRLAGTSLVSIVLPLSATGMMSVLAAEDDKTNWQKFVRASPASDWDGVCARYLVCGAVLLAVGIYVIMLNLACYLLFREQQPYLYLLLCTVGIVVAWVNALLVIPSCFGRGASGANIVSMGFVFLAGALAWLASRVDLSGFVRWLAGVPTYAYVLVGAVALGLATVLSMAVSKRVCRRRVLY